MERKLERLELKGLLISTKLPSEERLLFRFNVKWEKAPPLRTLRDKLTGITGRVRIDINRNKKEYRIRIPIFDTAETKLYYVRKHHFLTLKELCLVIQSIEEGGFRRNIYLLPTDNLEQFLCRWKKIEEAIEEINYVIRKEVVSEKYDKIIRALEELGFDAFAERLRVLRRETLEGGGWLLPRPKLTLQRLALRYEDIAELIESEELKEKVKHIIEEQYREHVKTIADSIIRQVEEIVKRAVESGSIKAVENARKEIRLLGKKAKSLGLENIGESIIAIADKIDPKTKIEKVTEELRARLLL